MKNVAQFGSQGYEYQYLVSLLIALEKLQNNINLYIEAIGQEDAFLRINSDNIQNIEIQVKRESKLLNINTLTKWIYHFEEYHGDKNLIEKILNNSIALFITESRCSDDLYKFKKDIGNLRPHEKLSIETKNRWISKFLKKMTSNEFLKGKSPLDKSRNKLLQNQVRYFDSDKSLNDFFNNVIIWEEVSHDKLNYEIENILNQKFNIPQSQCANVRRELYEIIIIGRNTKKDVIPLIEKIIQKNKSGRPQLNKGHQHLKREKEQELVKELLNNRLLLLTGRSFCGKSELAKKIAIHYFDKGFTYKNTDNVQALREFFNQNITEDKIAILEDPWGHIKPKDDSANIKRRIELLVSNLPINHKLIVTSRIEVLDEAFDIQLNINEYSWTDLSLSNSNELLKYWESFAERSNLSESVINLIVKNINQSNSLLEIGELEYLSRQRNLDIKTFEELVHIARQDSVQIARNLTIDNQAGADFLSILAFCSNTIQPISFLDLAYILQGENRYYSNSPQKYFSIGGDEEDTISFNYDENYELSKEHEDLITFLEDKGYIITDDNSLWFRHPSYYEAGRYLFSKNINRNFEYYKRALACWNSNTTYLAATQLYVLILNIKSRFIPELLKISFWLSQSIFPSTKDISLIFRIKNIEKLSEQQQSYLFEEIKDADSYSNYIHWKEDKPYIRKNSTGFSFFASNFDDLNIQEVLKKIDCQEKLSVREYFAVAKLTNLTPFVVEQLMQLNEAFIRNRTVYRYFSNIVKLRDKRLIEYIFSDRHPSIIYNAVYGCFVGWAKYSRELKDYLFEKIKLAFKEKAFVIRISRLITNFGVDYQGDHIWSNQEEKNTTEIWNLWGVFFPIFLDEFPTDVRFNSTRFTHTMSEAVKYMSIINRVNVFEAWYNIIDRDKKGQWILESHASSIMSYLIAHTKNNWEIRESLFDRIIEHNNTKFLLTSIAWSVFQWNDYLVDTEKKKIINLIDKERIDNIWIKASLICLNPTDDVSKLIFGDSHFLEKSPQYIIENTPTELLNCCLRLFYSFGKLQDLPDYNRNESFWFKIISHILENQIEPFFKMCLHDFLRSTISHNGREELLPSWEIICQTYDNAGYFLKLLMYWNGKIAFTISSTKYLWDVIIKSYQENSKEDLLTELMIENFGLLNNIENDFQLYKKVINPKIFEQVIIEIREIGYHLVKDEVAKKLLEIVDYDYEELKNWVE